MADPVAEVVGKSNEKWVWLWFGAGVLNYFLQSKTGAAPSPITTILMGPLGFVVAPSPGAP
jgi:hypothetical protein